MTCACVTFCVFSPLAPHRPVLDSECGQLQPGTRVVVMAKWPERNEQKWYNAQIVSADRKEHGPGARLCVHVC